MRVLQRRIVEGGDGDIQACRGRYGPGRIYRARGQFDMRFVQHRVGWSIAGTWPENKHQNVGERNDLFVLGADCAVIMGREMETQVQKKGTSGNGTLFWKIGVVGVLALLMMKESYSLIKDRPASVATTDRIEMLLNQQNQILIKVQILLEDNKDLNVKREQILNDMLMCIKVDEERRAAHYKECNESFSKLLRRDK
jgi:hypothetical protein